MRATSRARARVLRRRRGDGLADGPARQSRDGADLQADAGSGGNVGAVAVQQPGDQRVRQVHHRHLHGGGNTHAQHLDHARSNRHVAAARKRAGQAPAGETPPHHDERADGRHALRDHRRPGGAHHAEARRSHQHQVERHVHQSRCAHQLKRRARVALRLEKGGCGVHKERPRAAAAQHHGVADGALERCRRHGVRREGWARQRHAQHGDGRRPRQGHRQRGRVRAPLAGHVARAHEPRDDHAAARREADDERVHDIGGVRRVADGHEPHRPHHLADHHHVHSLVHVLQQVHRHERQRERQQPPEQRPLGKGKRSI